MACSLNSAKQSSEPNLDYCKLDPWEQNQFSIVKIIVGGLLLSALEANLNEILIKKTLSIRENWFQNIDSVSIWAVVVFPVQRMWHKRLPAAKYLVNV